MFKNFMTALAKARTKEALNRLSDKQLADIGIHRGGIHEHVESLYA